MKRNYQHRRQDRIAYGESAPSVHVCQQNLFEVEPISANAIQKHKRESNYVFDIVDALSAPILTFSHQWADTIPKRILDIIQLARLKALMQREELATYAECVVYIYTRTLDAPMDSEWTDIYTNVTCKTLEEWFGESHWDDIKAPKELSEWLLQKLNGLRRHIYDKRRQILKGQFREQEQAKRITTKGGTKEIASLQPDFGFKD